MVFRGSMTGRSSAASFMSSSMACSGKMRRVSMARIKRSAIVFCAGAGWASSTTFFPAASDAQRTGLNSKLHALYDGRGRPDKRLQGATLLMDAIDALPGGASELLADHGYDADWLRDALRARGMRRIAMRYDRCAHTFFSALCLAVSVRHILPLLMRPETKLQRHYNGKNLLCFLINFI